jgi:cysteinyl-tRNA synthetase
LLRSQYRGVLDFTFPGLDEARRELDRFYRALDRHPDVGAAAAVPPAVLSALCDDLNTPLAISAMHAMADAALAGDATAAADLRAAGSVLGLLQSNEWFQPGNYDAVWIKDLIVERLAARKSRDFAKADAIRADLAARGIVLEDGPDGTTWRTTQETTR